jgi:DNA-binding transcriptional regulator YdaS (Cro superfamily)
MDAKEIIAMLGGPAKVASLVGGISSQAVSQWRRVPARHCIALEKASGGRITVHDLRPDIFGPAQPQEAA